MGDTRSTGGKGAQGDLAGGGAGLEDAAADLSLIPLDEKLVLFACFSAFAPTLSTVGFGPIEVVGFGAIFAASFGGDVCSICGSIGGEGSFGSAGGLIS